MFKCQWLGQQKKEQGPCSTTSTVTSNHCEVLLSVRTFRRPHRMVTPAADTQAPGVCYLL